MMNKIAIWGAGSLGTVLGAYLTKGGKDVLLVDSYRAHVDALNEKGAQIIGQFEQFTVPVKAAVAEEVEGTFDLIIYMAKQTYNDTAIPQIVSHCHENTIICTCQNGIPELAVAKYYPKSKICGAPVGWGAFFRGPGVSELTSPIPTAYFHLGTLEGPITPWLLEVKDILDLMCKTTASDNLLGNRWAKVLINASLSGMSTVIGEDFGHVIDDPIGKICAAAIGHETVKVANASGTRLEKTRDRDYEKIYAYEEGDKEARAKVAEDLQDVFVNARKITASMLQDLQKGRKCEIAQIDGVVAETGDEYGIETPFTDMVIKVVKEIEDGKRTWGYQNLEDFKALI